jgi:hypothetical protein
MACEGDSLSEQDSRHGGCRASVARWFDRVGGEKL